MFISLLLLSQILSEKREKQFLRADGTDRASHANILSIPGWHIHEPAEADGEIVTIFITL
jgi:hypothetical protein